MTDVTQILTQIQAGDLGAADKLLPLVYDELRKLAAVRLENEQPGQTLEATALVHEAYVRLVDVDHVQHFNGRSHFFAAAAEAMRRILVDRARRKKRPKHGGHRGRVELDEACSLQQDGLEEVVAVSQALDKLAAESPAKAELVKLRYFTGMTVEQAAQALGISRATAHRYWAYAKVFLYCELKESRPT
jgi:RNA polymerase sigma factor (TIGR02999 family)